MDLDLKIFEDAWRALGELEELATKQIGNSIEPAESDVPHL